MAYLKKRFFTEPFLYLHIQRFLGFGGILADNSCNPPDTAVLYPDLDAVRVERGVGQDLLHDAPCQFSAPLIGLEDNIDRIARVYGIPVLSGGCWFWLCVHGNVQCVFGYDIVCIGNFSVFNAE
jgi:hypothetical protein